MTNSTHYDAQSNAKSPKDTIEKNKRTACEFIESLQDLTGARSASLMSESATWQVMARSKTLPLGDQLTKAQFCTMIQSMQVVFPKGVRHEIKTLTAEEDRVAIETESHADLPGGRVYRNVYHFLLRIEGDKVASAQEYTDLLYAKEVIFDPPLSLPDEMR
jgi:ketosteroid isomerase-like protein